MDFQMYDCNSAAPKLWSNNGNNNDGVNESGDYFNWTHGLKIEQSNGRKRKNDDRHDEQRKLDAEHENNEAKKTQREQNSSSSSRMASWQVEDIADLNADIDDSLQSLGNGEHSNTSFNMSEAILTLSNLASLKQEAPSPTNNDYRTSQQQNSPSNNNSNNNNNAQAINQNAQDQESGNSLLNATLHQLLSQSGYNSLQNPIDAAGNILNGSNQEAYSNSAYTEDSRFQYVLAAATSIATKLNEDTLTYLNQGQSYEIKLKKLGDLSMYRGKLLKSVIKICFHERRLQYMEKEQITSWQQSRPGDRILEIDVPLSYGLYDVIQPTNALNTVQFSWDPTKEVGAYIKVNCISTEFTPKKHGGEKGVPFRIQVETYQASDGFDSPKRLHAAACQIKVFKLKGADRKHKQDREKILKRSVNEQEKYQPSYDCTVLNDIPNEALMITPPISAPFSPESASQPFQIQGSLDEKQLVTLSPASSNSERITQEVDTTSAFDHILTVNSSTHQTANWLTSNRFEKYSQTFANFSGADMLRTTREDLIQICGHADGIRLHNCLHSKLVAPKLTIYVCKENCSVFNAIFLTSLHNQELMQQLSSLLNVQLEQIKDMYLQGPQTIHVQINSDLIKHIKDESMFKINVLNENGSLILLLKSINK